MTNSPFHSGEEAVQERLGVREQIASWASKVVRPFLPEEHRAFYSTLPFVIASARDGAGRPWATALAGQPGFISSPDAGTLLIGSRPVLGDALYESLNHMPSVGADIGLLGIELASRRRNRVNGRVRRIDGEGIVLDVDQAFGNCPQYISERSWRSRSMEGRAPSHTRSQRLADDQMALIRAADTFFIATGHRGSAEDARFGMDASHRGGAPGFVKVIDERTLIFPDYSGNNHFNTLGNLIIDPRAGLLFVDFESGGMLQLSGQAEIDWDSKEVARFSGARRLIRFRLDEVVSSKESLPLCWTFKPDASRALKLIEKVQESEDVASFVFVAADGKPLHDFVAGQHLPIELRMPGQDAPVTRMYSLSNGRGRGYYRISVKRESDGVASRFLHDELDVGGVSSVVFARPPGGDFVLNNGKRPVVLISAGIGVTPFVSVLHDIAEQGESRRVLLIHGARDGRHFPLASEIRTLVDSSDMIELHVALSSPSQTDREGRDFDTRGRVTGALLKATVPDLDSEFYLCGPTSFLASLQNDLGLLGVAIDRIHTESFGPT